MMYTLVIVDMQPDFVAANDKATVKGVIKAIKRAKQNAANIVVLEYGSIFTGHHKKTRGDIMRAIGDYPQLQVMTKWQDDGSEEVIRANAGFVEPTECFEVCGVNLGACVGRTIAGLVGFGKTVKVVKDACNQPDYFPYSMDTEFAILERHGVQLV